MKTINEYRGFKLETIVKGQTLETIAFLNNEPKFGTISNLDDLTSVEKMHIKIDKYLNK